MTSNLGRLVVSSINSPTSKISKFVDPYLQPIVTEIPSYVRQTKGFLHKTKSINNAPEKHTMKQLMLKPFTSTILICKNF